MKGMSRYAQKKSYYITYAFSEDEKTELKYINDYIDFIIKYCLKEHTYI